MGYSNRSSHINSQHIICWSSPQADILQKKGTGETGDYLNRQTEELGEDVFNEIIFGFTELAEDPEKNCFYYLKSNLDYDTLFDQFNVVITKTQEGATFYLRRKLKQANKEKETISDRARVPINGISPCLVYGSTNVQNFFESWISPRTGALSRIPPDFSTQTTMKLLDNKIITETEEVVNWYTEPSDKGDGEYVLYKHTDSVGGLHICFIPTTRDVSGAFNSGQCNYDSLLNNDCFDRDVDNNFYEAVTKHGGKIWSSATGTCQ